MIEDLQRNINKIVYDQNHKGHPDFEGYSPDEMTYILYETFVSNSPIQLQKLSESEYKTIPILNQIKYLVDLIIQDGELKLTSKGFLPPKVVADIYSQGFMKDEFIESGMSKLYKEIDAPSVNLTRILTEISGLAKKRNNKLSLTKKGEKIVSDNYELLKLILGTFGAKFNWAYFDGYGDNGIGQIGYGFSLILLSKYGMVERTGSFYAEKYLKAFPHLIDIIPPSHFDTSEDQAENCYSVRTFPRFLDYFGFIKIRSEEKWGSDIVISKTELFDKLIKCTPPNNT